MRIGESLLPEFDQEMAITRKVLARVPGGKAEWKPHPKSFAIGHLAQLLAGMPGWLTSILEKPSLDLASGGKYTFEKTETLLETFDRNVSAARAALAAVKDASLDEMWSLTMGDRVLSTDPRGAVVRNTISHLAHHRGQMTVYLRLLDVPVPSTYGPTADEGWGS
jgi:uncharacterized damage-inducible protein DinB